MLTEVKNNLPCDSDPFQNVMVSSLAKATPTKSHESFSVILPTNKQINQPTNRHTETQNITHLAEEITVYVQLLNYLNYKPK